MLTYYRNIVCFIGIRLKLIQIRAMKQIQLIFTILSLCLIMCIHVSSWNDKRNTLLYTIRHVQILLLLLSNFKYLRTTIFSQVLVIKQKLLTRSVHGIIISIFKPNTVKHLYFTVRPYTVSLFAPRLSHFL